MGFFKYKDWGKKEHSQHEKIYVLRCPECEAYKIGRSKNPWRRFPEIVRGRGTLVHQNQEENRCTGGEGPRLEIVAIFLPDEPAKDVERRLHKKFTSASLPRVSTGSGIEWVWLDSSEVGELKQMIADCEEGQWWVAPPKIAPFNEMTKAEKHHYRNICPDSDVAPSDGMSERERRIRRRSAGEDSPRWKNPYK